MEFPFYAVYRVIRLDLAIQDLYNGILFAQNRSSMLTFLNNIFLPALAAAILPILIHLLTRRRLVERQWPSLRFIEEIQKRRMRRFKLKQILLLVLRVLILLLVIGAFARPAIRGARASTSTGSRERTSIALLLDASYSMGQEAAGVDLFTKARQSAEDILELVSEGDEIAVIPFAEMPAPTSPEPYKSMSGAKQALDSLHLRSGTTDVWNAIALGVELLSKSRLPNREIFVLTDNKNHGWRRSGEMDIPEGINLYALVFSPDDDRNIGISSIEFPRTLLQKDVPFSLQPEFKSYASGAIKDFVANLYLDGEKVAQRAIDLAPGEAASIEFRAQVDEGGFHFGEFRCEGDALPADNSRFFSFKIPEKIEVLVVGGNEAKFIANALAPVEGDFFNVSRISYSRLGSELLSTRDVIILSDPPELSANLAASIDGFVSRGGGLAVLLGGSPDPAKSWRSVVGENFPISVVASIGDSLGKSRFVLGGADFEHPVFTPFKKEGLPDVEFKRVAAIVDADRVPIVLSNGVPLIAETELGDGKIAICAFSASLSFGDIATGGFFVPLMHRLTQYLNADVSEFDPGYLVGDEIVRTIDATTAGAFALIQPDGSRAFLAPRFAAGRTILSVGGASLPGIYQVLAEEKIVDLFAVNVDTRESDSDELDRGAVENAVKIVWISTDKDIADEILSRRYGRELHHAMLIVAFILMLVELVLGGTWRRQRDLSDRIRDREM